MLDILVAVGRGDLASFETEAEVAVLSPRLTSTASISMAAVRSQPTRPALYLDCDDAWVVCATTVALSGSPCPLVAPSCSHQFPPGRSLRKAV
jgi:hypothetical protein